jgi:uncharacterized protein YkwD
MCCRPSAQAPLLATRALELVNEARARGTRCGVRVVRTRAARTALRHAGEASRLGTPPTWPNTTTSNTRTSRVARRPTGSKRSDTKRNSSGENIAYGPKTAEEVVQGWLDSPGHCENIMDPRFAEMGIAFAAGHASRRGLFWVQLLALHPRPEIGTAGSDRLR